MTEKSVPTIPSGDSHQGLLADSNPAISTSQQTSAVRSVARQPILDRHSKVYGYELLFWNGQESELGLIGQPTAEDMLGNAKNFEMEQLSSGLPAFVRLAGASLSEEWVLGFPPDLTVVEVAESEESSPTLLDACHNLKKLGFRVALDGFTGQPATEPLLELADYVKVDLARFCSDERRALLRHVENSSARPLAKTVETQQDYREASDEGFELFQGYYFCHPEPVKNHKIPANHMVQLEILEVLQKESVDLHRLAQLVVRDASLTYRLLRLVNSALFGLRHEVTSVQSALMQLGEDKFRRMAALAIASDFNAGQPPELLRMAFERGRFCDLSAVLLGLDSSEQYLIGMVSMFPAMLRILMDDLVQLLPLRESARDALLGKANKEGVFLELLLCQDRGDWKEYDAILKANQLQFGQLMWRLSDAIGWANALVKSTA
jgi:EAL and modified HD-GYP domain-containing signal transduction protein